MALVCATVLRLLMRMKPLMRTYDHHGHGANHARNALDGNDDDHDALYANPI